MEEQNDLVSRHTSAVGTATGRGGEMSEEREGLVGILGFGVMGVGIAQVCLRSGYRVVVLDETQAKLEQGTARLRESLDGAEQRGKLSSGDASRLIERLLPTTSLDDFSSVSLVIEAVAEIRDVKLQILRSLGEQVSSNVVIATNTSALSVTELARAVPNEGRFAGLHFFNPVPAMALVEVVRGMATKGETVDELMEFAGTLGKTAVTVDDRPGFLVNRLLMPYLNDVVQALDEKLASAKDIDLAMELGLGYPTGPLKLLDLIGLDVHEHATRAAYESTHDCVFAPPPLLQRMVQAGFVGNKVNHGFVVESERVSK